MSITDGITDCKQVKVNRKGSYTWRRTTYHRNKDTHRGEIHMEGEDIRIHRKELHTKEDTH